MSSSLTTKDGAFMETRGCNRWQSVANATPRKRRKQAKTVAVGCDRLPFAAHGKGVDSASSLLSEVAHHWRTPLDLQRFSHESRLHQHRDLPCGTRPDDSAGVGVRDLSGGEGRGESRAPTRLARVVEGRLADQATLHVQIEGDGSAVPDPEAVAYYRGRTVFEEASCSQN